MTSPDEAEKRRLARLDSPARVGWLKERVRGYVTDLAGRTFFRLPTIICGHFIDSPKAEAVACCIRMGNDVGLTGPECAAAFKAEWAAAMKLAQQEGEKLKITGLSHIKITGSARGVEAALQAAVAKFPSGWPRLTRDDVTIIAAGFQRSMKPRGRT